MTIDPKPITWANIRDFRAFLNDFKEHAESCFEGCVWCKGADESGPGHALVGEYCDRGHTLLERWLRVPNPPQ